MKDKSERHRHDTPAGNGAMVSAIFGAVANFGNSPKEKLEAVIRAGKIAEAFLSGTGDGTSPPARDTKVFGRNRSKIASTDLLLPSQRFMGSLSISTRKIGKAMRRSCVVAITLLLVIDLWAGDPWKQKTYKIWSQSDVRAIMNESPWAKRITVEGGQTKRAGLETPEDGATSEGAAGEEADGGGGRDEDNERGRIILVIRWVSSRTMRQAWVRGEVLQKRVSGTDTDKFLPPPSDDAQLLIVGRDMSLFEKLDEATLLAKSFLLRTKSKERINPIAVHVVRLPNGKGIKGILFHFPKKPLVSPSTMSIDDSDLKFVSQAGATEIKTSFDLQKMVDNEGMDL
jgi:hypothetical protein